VHADPSSWACKQLSTKVAAEDSPRHESQMSLIGAEACRMNAACALGLCVAGLRGQLRKLPFGVSACYAGLGRAPPVVYLSWVACSGDVFSDLKSSEFDLSMALSTATFVSDVVSACRLPWLSRTPPRRLSTSCLCRADPQLQGSRTAVGTAPAPTPPSAAGPCPALPRGGLGSREGFAPRRLRHDSVQRVSIFVAERRIVAP
jgi:hypothetical protein